MSFKLREEVLKTDYPPFRNVIFRAAANGVYNRFVHIYTDGSKDPSTGKTDMAFYVEPLPPMKSFIGRAHLTDNVSVYATELTAILHALIWIKLNNREFSNYVIFSDSLSALMVIGESKGRNEMIYLTTHSTHFIYGYMASDIWLRTILIVRKETRCRHIGYSFRLTARVLLYAPSHRQDNTYQGLCYTSCGALAGTRIAQWVHPMKDHPTDRSQKRSDKKKYLCQQKPHGQGSKHYF